MSSRSDRSAGCTCATPPRSSTSLRDLLELLARARDEDHLAAGLADLQRQLGADARRRAGDQDPLALRPTSTASARGTGPGRGCAPSSPTACPRRNRAAARRCRCRAARAGCRGRRSRSGTRGSRARPAGCRGRRGSGRGSRLMVGIALSPARTGLGTMFVRFASTRIANRGAWAALANVFSVSPDGHRLAGDEVERVAVQVVVVHVGDVVHRLGDEVDRHEVRVPALRARRAGTTRAARGAASGAA